MSKTSSPDISSVTVEDRKGSYDITRHLLELGHRRFLIAGAMMHFRPPLFHPGTGNPRTFAAIGPA